MLMAQEVLKEMQAKRDKELLKDLKPEMDEIDKRSENGTSWY
jgi:23S rRNA maturation mini-RNase III